MAEIMANPELKKELISWPNFITYYLFFDTWIPPFDNLKVRQAFSHAIDRDKIVNGPLQYQAVAAYSMNPPGFPGENVEGLKDVQAFDPALAKQLLAEAGYPNGEGFPKLTMYTREANPALTNAAEAIAAMLKENLNLTVEIQTSYSVSQPAPLSSGSTEVVPQVGVGIKEEKTRNLVLKDGATVEELVRALSSIGSTPRDVIAILQSLAGAGALEAEVEVI
jgi:ABC-type transport system substrate-binding protein